MKNLLRAILLVTMVLSCSVAFAQDERDYIDRRPVKEIMVIRGVIDEIKDGRVTISGADAAEMRKVILDVTHRTHLLNGQTGNKMELRNFSKGMAVTAYFDSVLNDRDTNKSKNNSNPPSRSGVPYSDAYAIVSGNSPTTAKYLVVAEANRMANATQIVDFNKMESVTIADNNLFSPGPLAKGQEVLVWLDTNSSRLPNQGVASKAIILSQPIIDKTRPTTTTNTNDIVVDMAASSFMAGGRQWPLNTNIARYNNTIYLPLREAGQSLGYTVTWNPSTRTAQLQQGNMTATATIGSYNYGKAGTNVSLSFVPRLVNGVTYVPVDFFSQVLNRSVLIRENR